MLQSPLSTPVHTRPEAYGRRPRVAWVLQRYLGREVLKTFVFVFLVIEVSYALLAAVVATRQLNLELPLVVPVMWYAGLSILNKSVPLGLLFAAGLVYGRLVADREVMALKSFGCSYLGLLSPVILLGLTFTAVGYGINSHVVPEVNSVRRDVGRLLTAQLRYLGEGWNRDFPFSNWSVWILHHSGASLEGIFVSPRDDSPRDEILPPAVEERIEPLAGNYYFYAGRGRIVFDDSQRERTAPAPAPALAAIGADPATEESQTVGSIFLELEDVDLLFRDSILTKDRNFFMQRWHLDSLRIPFDPAGQKRKYRHHKTLSNPELVLRWTEIERRLDSGAVPPDEARKLRKASRAAITEYHQRWSWLFTYLLFPTLAALIALFLNSANRLLPFFVSAITLPTLYFGLSIVGGILGETGFVPGLALQVGNAILAAGLAVGLVLLERKVLR